MDYKRFQRIMGALMAAGGLFTIVWVLWGRDMQGMGVLAGAALLILGGLMHLFEVRNQGQKAACGKG